MWCRSLLCWLFLIAYSLELTSADEDEDNPFFLQAEKSIPRIGRQPKDPNKGSNDDFTNFFMKASKSVPRIGRRNEAAKADNKLPHFMIRIPGRGEADKYIKYPTWSNIADTFEYRPELLTSPELLARLNEQMADDPTVYEWDKIRMRRDVKPNSKQGN